MSTTEYSWPWPPGRRLAAAAAAACWPAPRWPRAGCAAAPLFWTPPVALESWWPGWEVRKTTTTVDFCTVTTAGVNVWMRARSNGLGTRIADLFRWRHVAKKTIDDESESREKKTTMVSKSGTTHGLSDRRWNGGSCRCQQCNNNNNYSTHNHGWTGVGERQIYVAWSGVGMWPGVGVGANIQQWQHG